MCLFSLAAATPATAATYYLDANNGNDGNPGSSDQPWKTLAKAQSFMNSLGDNGAGDTVLIRNGSYGTYSENVIVRTDWLTYKAETGHTPDFNRIEIGTYATPGNAYIKFDGIRCTDDLTENRWVLFTRRVSYVQFLNLDVIGLGTPYVNGSSGTNRGLDIWENCSYITVDGCTFSGGGNTGRFDGFAGTVIQASGTEKTNLVITDNELTQFGEYGINVHCNNHTITGNNIHKFGGDGIVISGGDGPLLVEDNQIHDLYLYQPDLNETPTETTWSADGLTMYNNSATWEVGEPYDWEGTVELRVNSGTNVNTGDNDVTVATVISPTEILLGKSIKADAEGATPSNVDYYFISVTHADLIQVFAGTASNLTFRGNRLYDCEGQITWINPSNTGNPPSNIGGSDIIFENNLCWNSYADGQAEYGGVVSLEHIDGLTVRNNTVIGRLNIGYSTDVAMHGNIVGYLSIADDTILSSNNYNIFCRGGFCVPNEAGENTTFLFPGYSWDNWNDSTFTGIFADYANGDFSLASSSLAIDKGDPANYPATDILGVSRSIPPDAGCYEYVSADGNNAPVLVAIGNKSVSENSTLSFSVSATDADGDSITYSATGTAIDAGATLTGQSFSWTPDYTQAGSYQVTFTASDGTASDSETITITVNNTNRAPVLASIGDQPVSENGALSFTLSATDADSDTITYSATGLPTGATLGSSSGDFTWTPGYSQAGTYEVTFTASDGTDQDSETITITVSNTNQAPALASIGDQSVNENIALSFSVSATDADSDTITYSVTGLPTGATLGSSSGDFTWTPGYTQAGTHQVTFVASDSQAQDSETITITVNNVNRAPVLSSIGDKSVYEEDSLSFTVSATDADSDTITYSATGLPSGATFSDQNFSWTPSGSQAGSYDVTFTASDSTDQDSEVITITVTADTAAPTVSNLSPAADSIQVSLNSLVSLGISDQGKGVDAATVTIEVNGNIVYTGDTAAYNSSYGHCYRTGTSASYRYFFQADEIFDYDQTTTVAVNATDLGGNAMAEYSYSFETEMRSFGKNKKVNSSSNSLNDGAAVTASDSSGNIWVVWHTGQTGSRDVYIGKLTAGADSFSSSVQVTNNDTDQSNPVIAIDSADKLYVAWQDSQNGEWDIYLSASTNGTNFSTERKITDPNSNQINPAIAIDSSNTVYVAWEDDQNSNEDIYIASSSNSFVSKTTSQITSNTSNQTSPAIAVDSGNTVYVVWTDARGGTSDIYGADSDNGPWTNVAVASNANNQSSPAIATEASGTILHLLWVDDTSGNSDIYYASSDGLPSSSLSGSSLIDDSSSASPSAPAIIVTGSTGNGLKVFACWEDERNVSGSNGDTDIYLVEVNSGSGTNVFVGDDSTNAAQSSPAMAIDGDGYPYLVWTDGRNTNMDIYYAGSTFAESTALESEDVTASSGVTVGTELANINSTTDVSVIIPVGASSHDAIITISRVKNPQKLTLDRFSIPYEFGPSGIEFDQPVTIIIPYDVSTVGNSPSAYWYNPLLGLLSQEGITNVETIEISSNLYALSFQTTHFTQFLVGGGIAAAVGGGGGGGGGCSMSPDSNGSIIEYFLPYFILAVVMIIIKWRDKRNKKANEDMGCER